ncbi:heterogeneous nuclear ribonucleoprotein L-like [Physella acuta]|uniref:heterogeneous nuclear ribonucleoprotein L-like n=1 Tax=Physella acuta TaxID=109671 RepID=UPI0027DDCE2E|nr:heterogeneous nuclear ribonucleoprotein L-like [Physella acuta]
MLKEKETCSNQTLENLSLDIEQYEKKLIKITEDIQAQAEKTRHTTEEMKRHSEFVFGVKDLETSYRADTANQIAQLNSKIGVVCKLLQQRLTSVDNLIQIFNQNISTQDQQLKENDPDERSQSALSLTTDDECKDFEDRFEPPVSKCVHVTGLPKYASEADLTKAVRRFGKVNTIFRIPSKKNQAIVEFEDFNQAKHCVEYCRQRNSINVAGKPAFFNFSRKEHERPAQEENDRRPSRILLFTILNPKYPITVDVMHAISSYYGQIQKIIILKKKEVQAMVEFDNVESAKQAKHHLNGVDIYAGCCSLKVEYAKRPN